MLQRSNAARLAEVRLWGKQITVTALQQREIAGDSDAFIICTLAQRFLLSVVISRKNTNKNIVGRQPRLR
jgi:hypothetical protein